MPSMVVAATREIGASFLLTECAKFDRLQVVNSARELQLARYRIEAD